MKHGFVSIVGAGPGDPDLLTVKGLKAIQQADAVVYDRLIGADILALIPTGVMRIFAGKSCKQHFMPQEEINSLLVQLASSGRRVVRLKGGDPFIFGRGGEEAEYLAQHHIPFEIVPGISSASGCSAYSGIPLTHRGLATGVRYLTGHCQYRSDEHKDGVPDLNWPSLADKDTTLVVYMGLTNLASISSELMAHGLSGATPAAAIQEGTTERQKVVVATLADIAVRIREEAIQSPALVIIGNVVSLSEKLQWFMPASFAPAASSGLPPQQTARLRGSQKRRPTG